MNQRSMPSCPQAGRLRPRSAPSWRSWPSVSGRSRNGTGACDRPSHGFHASNRLKLFHICLRGLKPMVATWAVVLSALVYLCFLFTVAHWGDTGGRRFIQGPARSTIAALALAVYCTSWTFFGSVGLASHSGFDFLAIYIGPILVIGFGYPLVARIVRIAKTQNISSIADFVAARYGKSERVAALVSLIALVG